MNFYCFSNEFSINPKVKSTATCDDRSRVGARHGGTCTWNVGGANKSFNPALPHQPLASPTSRPRASSTSAPPRACHACTVQLSHDCTLHCNSLTFSRPCLACSRQSNARARAPTAHTFTCTRTTSHMYTAPASLRRVTHPQPTPAAHRYPPPRLLLLSPPYAFFFLLLPPARMPPPPPRRARAPSLHARRCLVAAALCSDDCAIQPNHHSFLSSSTRRASSIRPAGPLRQVRAVRRPRQHHRVR